MANQRTGKIARLPKDLRDVVNLMLRDGATYQQVIDRLTTAREHGAKNAGGEPIEIPSDMNLTNWSQGGYQDWLKEQARLEGLRAKREFALELVRQDEGSKVPEAAMILAASQISEVLEDFDVETLKELLREEPENYAQVVNALTKLAKGNLEVQKYKEFVREQKQKIEAALGAAKSKGGLTPETLKTIEEAAAML